MNRTARSAGVIACVAGVSAVALGAFGAHALRGRIDADALAVWRTAVDYQMWHALALLALAALSTDSRTCRSTAAAAAAFTAGIVIFSGSLYALALGAPRWLGAITPLGGLAFLLGWLLLGWGFLRRSRLLDPD